MFPFFNKLIGKELKQQASYTDTHAHILPGLDDGVKNMEYAIAVIRSMKELGYKKLIATPHILSDYYPNSKETILKVGNEVKSELKKREIDIELEISAEYFLDEHFQKLLDREELLPLEGNRILVELSTIGRPFNFEQPFWNIIAKGYQPVLAHPERYRYLKAEDYDRLLAIGCEFQVNLFSFQGYYGKIVQETAKKLLRKKAIHLLGSDIHHLHQIPLLKSVLKSFFIREKLNSQLTESTIPFTEKKKN